MSSQETEPQSGGGEPSGVLSDATWLDRQWLWALVGLSVLGLLLRAFLLDGQSLWLDEGYTLRHAGHPASFGDLVQFGPQESPSPPLYYVLLHLWLRVTGVTPMAGRAFSVVCGSLTVPAFAVLLRPLIGARTALSSSLLLAVSPLHIYYSQETRPYAPMLLFFILSTHCLSRALQTRRAGTWFLHWLTTTVCVYALHRRRGHPWARPVPAGVLARGQETDPQSGNWVPGWRGWCRSSVGLGTAVLQHDGYASGI